MFFDISFSFRRQNLKHLNIRKKHIDQHIGEQIAGKTLRQLNRWYSLHLSTGNSLNFRNLGVLRFCENLINDQVGKLTKFNIKSATQIIPNSDQYSIYHDDKVTVIQTCGFRHNWLSFFAFHHSR